MRVLGDRVLVRPIKPEPPSTESGIKLADSYYYMPEVSGTVIALGDGPKAEDGTQLWHCVNIGDTVIFPAESGHEVVIDGEHLLVLREQDLLAILYDVGDVLHPKNY